MEVVKFVKVNSNLINYVAENMRYNDVLELQLLGNTCTRKALEESVSSSHYVSAAIIKGTPVCIFGLSIHDMINGDGVPWMLGTADIVKYRREILVEGKNIVNEMMTMCDRLVNIVHSENVFSISWLKKIGFTIGDAVTFNGDVFYKFYIGDCDV